MICVEWNLNVHNFYYYVRILIFSTALYVMVITKLAQSLVKGSKIAE
jgi:hypothetical protein